MRTTAVKFRDWPWRARLIEKLYRLAHGGRIRTLVLSDDQLFAAGQSGRQELGDDGS